MITAHDALDALHREGARHFLSTDLARDHAGLTRRVRRGRAVRSAATSVVAVGAAGAIAFVATHQGQPQTPAGSPTPPASASGFNVTGTITVKPGERVQEVAGLLAAVFGVTRAEAYAAIVAALPPEAQGDPEGWAAVGDYHFQDYRSLADAAGWLVSTQVGALESTGQPHERWRDIIIAASIVEQEAPRVADRSAVAQVIDNRLAAKMPLQLDSPLEYVGQDYWALVGVPQPSQDGYDTFANQGLPVGAIGAPSRESIAAAADPFPGSWLYFLREVDGSVTVFDTRDEYVAALKARVS